MLSLPETGVPPVQLRVLRVSASAAGAERDSGLLSGEERARAAKFVRSADRERYLVAHVALRRELSARTGVPPDGLALYREPCPLCGGPHGRPALRADAGEQGEPGEALPHFSLSHAGDLVLLAFAAAPVGVDVEEYPGPDTVDSAAEALHPRERAELAALDGPEARSAAFARCWTRKEAYLKGTGAGLGEDPSVQYTGTAAAGPFSPAGWRLADAAVPPGHAAAYAVRLTRSAE